MPKSHIQSMKYCNLRIFSTSLKMCWCKTFDKYLNSSDLVILVLYLLSTDQRHNSLCSGVCYKQLVPGNVREHANHIMWFRVVKCGEVLLRSTIVWCVKAMRTISPPALITHQSNALTIISLVDTPHLIHNTHIRLRVETGLQYLWAKCKI